MIARLLHRQSRAFVLVAMAVALAGMIAALSLPTGLFPQVSFPRVVVDLDAGAARPARPRSPSPARSRKRSAPFPACAMSARKPAGDRRRSPSTLAGAATWSPARCSSISAIARVLPALPAGTAYNVRRMDPTVFPIISYALVARNGNPVALQDLARYQITPLLSSIEGLARVDVQGGQTAEVQVLADPRRLADHALAMRDLTNAIRDGNVLSAVGQVQDRGRLRSSSPITA
jgi:multidrug efflux pump subunit AcrB